MPVDRRRARTSWGLLPPSPMVENLTGGSFPRSSEAPACGHDVRLLVQFAARSSMLPLVAKLAHHVFRGEVQVDFGRGEAVMAEEALQGGQGDALLHRRHRKGMAQHLRGHRPLDMRAVGDTLDQDLDGAGAIPRVSCKTKCPSISGWMRGDRGMMRRL